MYLLEVSYVLVFVLLALIAWLAKNRAALRKEVAQLRVDLATAQVIPTEGTEQSLQGIAFDLWWVCRKCGWFGESDFLHDHVQVRHRPPGPVDARYEEILAGSLERIVVRSERGGGAWCNHCGGPLEHNEEKGGDYCSKCGIVQYS